MSDEHGEIHMTNLNIRASISILVARLLLIDFLTAFLIILFYFTLISGAELTNFLLTNPSLLLISFTTLGTFKILTTMYIVLQWLNEYYEITHDAVIHKKGIIFKKTEKYKLDNVREITITSGLWGQIFNYGTITLFDIRKQKYLDMYLIHNPNRYVRVFEQLKPDIEIEREDINVNVLQKEED